MSTVFSNSPIAKDWFASPLSNSHGRLLHGPEDFAERLHDVLFDRSRKIRMFGKFTALELFGTVRPEEFPPVNGRMIKALRFLGYTVQ